MSLLQFGDERRVRAGLPLSSAHQASSMRPVSGTTASLIFFGSGTSAAAVGNPSTSGTVPIETLRDLPVPARALSQCLYFNTLRHSLPSQSDLEIDYPW